LRRRVARVAASSLVACALVLGWWISAEALAEEFVFDARTGDEIEARIEPGDQHRYLVPVIAGTRLDVRLRGEAVEPDGDDDPAKDERGVVLGLTVRDPVGEVRASRSGKEVDVRVTAAKTGTFELVVASGAVAADYDLDIEAEFGSIDVGGAVDVTDGPVAIRLAAPLGTSARIDVRRISGGAPVVVAVRDGLGRELGFIVKKSSRNRVRLRPIPVAASGGLEVVVGTDDSAGGSYEISLDVEDDDDDAPDEDDDREERKIIVHIAPGTDVVALAAQLEARFDWELEDVGVGYAVFEVPEEREGFEDEDAREAAAQFPEILDAEPDARAQTPEGSQSNGVVIGSSLGRSDFDGQPALAGVRAAKAHRKRKGRGVVVAVLDTGIDRTHSLFTGRVLAGRDFVDDDDDPAEEQDGIDDDLDGDTDEGFGHGTFVAGLVLAAAPDARILPLRVLDTEGRGRASDIAAAILHAKDEGADVINLSLGARSRSEVLRGAVRVALSHGILVVAAAGNGSDARHADFPAGLGDVIGVTALAPSGRRADFANAGSRLAVAAPGVDLIGPFLGDRWGTWSGTSFSAALVSGGAALLVEARPSAPLGQLLRLFRRRSRGFGRRVPRAERKLLGAGVLDLGRLVR
jgi:subtilisin family serine protease